MNIKQWYFTKTLIAGKPDIDRRTIWRGGVEVRRFNVDMAKEWTPEQDRALQRACDALNEAEFGGRDEV